MGDLALSEQDPAPEEPVTPSQLPPGWDVAALGDLIGFDGLMVDGDWVESKDQDRNGRVRLIQLADIGEGQFLDKSNRFLTEDTAQRLRCTFLQKNDILIARMAAPLGRACAYPGLPQPAVTVVDVCIWRSVRGFIEPRWIMHMINSLQTRKAILADASGTTRQRVAGGKLRRILVPVPPLAEQRRIAASVDALFAEIEEGEAALEETRKGLDTFRRALLKAAVTGELTEDWRAENPAAETGQDLLLRIKHLGARRTASGPRSRRSIKMPAADVGSLPSLPEGWAWSTLGEVGHIVGGATVDQKRKPDDPVTVPYLRVANVQRGHIDLSVVKSITVERSTADKLRLVEGDLLLNEGGDRDKIGRGWVWDGAIPGMIHQNHVFRVRLHSKSLLPTFVSHYANEMGRRFFIEEGKQTTNLASISLSKISMLPVPIPPPSEAEELLRRVEDALAAHSDVLATLDAEAADAARLKQSVLKAAFEGRLVPQDPADEPASALLARLAAMPEARTERRKKFSEKAARRRVGSEG
jgi:type I restriction enzyme S subunit